MGSTPAHAGNTAANGPARDFVEVYPRPRGEYGSVGAMAHNRYGLPPPTRGIPAPDSLVRLREGSTPAHAGNTR